MPFQFFSPTKKVTVTQGDLPHWEQEGATYFITWRTADSIPQKVWLRWRRERDAWLATHQIDPASKDWRIRVEGLPEEERIAFRRFSRSLERELDACHGACVLRQQGLALQVAEALTFFDGTRYALGDFVVMPNHVHLLVGGMQRHAMLHQVESWKRWTALRLNKALGRTGRLWQNESFDHLVRDEISFQKLRRYIAENPAKAGLRVGEYVLRQMED